MVKYIHKKDCYTATTISEMGLTDWDDCLVDCSATGTASIKTELWAQVVGFCLKPKNKKKKTKKEEENKTSPRTWVLV